MASSSLLLSKYRLERLLGQGAFAEVYLATHLELGQPRALKLLRRDAPGLGSTEYTHFAERFKLEARLGAMLDHPNLVRVYGLEEDGEALILVMEYCPGGNLADCLDRSKQAGQPIPVDDCLSVARDVAQGLAEIHKMDAIHRDLKPANILFDAQGCAKVADLGLAQVPGGPSLRSRLSQPAPHPGTSGYMSPEQEHSSAMLKPASDIYSLGLILFELLTGRNYGLLRPGTNVQAFRSAVPAWLNKLVMMMLSEDPTERPWDGEEAARLLRYGETSLASRFPDRQGDMEEGLLSTRRMANKIAKERKIGWLTVGIGLVALIGLLAIGFFNLDGRGSFIPKANEILHPTARYIQAQPSQVTATDQPAKTPAHSPSPTPSSLQNSTPTLAETSAQIPLPAQLVDEFGIQMALIPSNIFRMGEQANHLLALCQSFNLNNDICPSDRLNSEEPVHSVFLDSYYMDVYEVTNAAYAKCVKESDCSPPSSNSSYGHTSYFDNPNYSNYPVININWYQARDYCNWREARLPTEAEWEYAARSGLVGKNYPWGDNFDGNLANFCDAGCDVDTWSTPDYVDGFANIAPVGSYPPNSYGLYDMAGNVWEWVFDRYGPYSSEPTNNPVGLDEGIYRALRGGSWSDLQFFLRVSTRNGNSPEFNHFTLGFRCAYSP